MSYWYIHLGVLLLRALLIQCKLCCYVKFRGCVYQLMINTLYLSVKILDLQRRTCFINTLPLNDACCSKLGSMSIWWFVIFFRHCTSPATDPAWHGNSGGPLAQWPRVSWWPFSCRTVLPRPYMRNHWATKKKKKKMESSNMVHQV